MPLFDSSLASAFPSSWNQRDSGLLQERIQDSMDNKKRLAYAMVKYLKNEASSGQYSSEAEESLEGITH